MPCDMNLGRLTPGEALYLTRRRKGITQAQSAATKGLARATLWRMETGRPHHQQINVAALRHPITRPEMVLLARRRLGWTQKEAARRFGKETGLPRFMYRQGTSRPTYIFWEKDGDPRVVDFYRKKGFTFV